VVQKEDAACEAGPVLRISDYCTEFDGDLLKHVNFELMPGEKAVIAGANGTGKTSLIRDILINENPSVQIAEGVRYACLSQLQIEAAEENSTVYDLMQKNGFTTKEKIREYLSKFCFPADITEQRICELSGGEQNLLQIALIANTDAELLILDEPTSHLDLYGQLALEKAIAEYKGAVLMVSHDFYLISGCADYVLIVEDHTVRRMRTKNFRRMVYDRYFDRSYLETDRRKQEIELAITEAFQQNDFAAADRLCTELEELSGVPADR
ncbi:MAG: ATP-binding cassette domain-containing protein, partial [Emergencia sp.]|nr:ATP-binding cassette domain-containing protein [Emergencia sp.]